MVHVWHPDREAHYLSHPPPTNSLAALAPAPALACGGVHSARTLFRRACSRRRQPLCSQRSAVRTHRVCARARAVRR